SLLVSGVRTKDMPEILGISLSTIEKRKNQIRMYLNFLKATDNELIKEAKKQGLI
ncbi:MAG: DNA-binding response regulator, partial [Flavobacterium sp.]|nr:DNA-binding response regulator [Flavobacterium sp.]